MFCLLPVLLLRGKVTNRAVPQVQFVHHRRVAKVAARSSVLTALCIQPQMSQPRAPQSEEQRAESSCRKVQLGEVTRRDCSCHLGLRQHSGRCSRGDPSASSVQSIAAESQPDPLQVDRKIFLKSLKSAPKGSTLASDEVHVRALANVVGQCSSCWFSLAQASVLREIGAALTGTQMTAFRQARRRCARRHDWLLVQEAPCQDIGEAFRHRIREIMCPFSSTPCPPALGRTAEGGNM